MKKAGIKHLTLPDRFRIAKILEERKDEYTNRRAAYATVAAELSRELNLPISNDTLRYIARSAGIDWDRVYSSRSTQQTKMGELTCRIARLEHIVVNLLEEMNMDVPDYLPQQPEQRNQP